MSGDDSAAEEITIDARRFAGVWANAVRVNGDHDEMTMDFVRLDPFERRGMVVARVTCSPGFLRTLMDELERIWHDWMSGSSPPETRNR